LEAAIKRAESWSADVAAEAAAAVTLRPPPDAPGMLLLQPMGAATLRQKVLPFDRTLERFGQFAIQGPNRYDIDGVSVGAAPAATWALVQDHFAPGDFENLNETDKLSRPSFESMDAGVRVGGDFVEGPLAAMKVARLDYETRIVDSGWAGRSLGGFLLDRALQLATLLRSSKSQSALALSGPAKFAATVREAPAVTLDPETYTITAVDTLTTDADGGLTKGAALRALKDRGAPSGLQVVPEYERETVG